MKKLFIVFAVFVVILLIAGICKAQTAQKWTPNLSVLKAKDTSGKAAKKDKIQCWGTAVSTGQQCKHTGSIEGKDGHMYCGQHIKQCK